MHICIRYIQRASSEPKKRKNYDTRFSLPLIYKVVAASAEPMHTSIAHYMLMQHLELKQAWFDFAMDFSYDYSVGFEGFRRLRAADKSPTSYSTLIDEYMTGGVEKESDVVMRAAYTRLQS
jgi:hypothetical protein